MNTTLLLPALFASDGGIERILRLYVRAVGELTRTGRAHAVVLNDRAIAAEKLAPFATPALAAPIACGRNKLTCAWHTLRLARHAQRVICGHMHLLRLAHLVRRFTPTAEVWLIAHGLEVWRDFSPAERRALVATDRVLCVSDFTRRQLLSRCSALKPARVCVQPNALDPQFEEPALDPTATQPGLILSVARLNAAERYKGIDHLITALPAIRAVVPAARLRIVGDGDDRARLEKIAAQAGMTPQVEFVGRVSDDALRAHFAQCALFALPSQAEGFGLVYLEALAHGKPCLAAYAGGAPEVVNAACGTLVPHGDVNAIAQACIATLQQDWNANTLRMRAAHFSYDAFRERLAAIWRTAA